MKSLPLFLLTLLLWLPLAVLADETSGTVKYAPLVVIDGLTNATNGGSFSDYIDFLYGLSIAIAALLAVIKIIVAGVKYMMSSLPGTKGNAKSEIQGALLGLLLILGAYLILNTINPALTKTTVNFQSLKENPKYANRPAALKPASSAPAGGAAGGAVTAATALQQFKTGAFPTCADRYQGVSSDGKFDTVRLDATTCNIDDKQAALRLFSEICRSVSGSALGSNGTKCALPKGTVSTSPIVGAGAANQESPEADRCATSLGTQQIQNKDAYVFDLSKCSATAQAVVKARLRISPCEQNSINVLTGDKVYCFAPKPKT